MKSVPNFSQSNAFFSFVFLCFSFFPAAAQVVKFQHTFGGNSNDYGRSVQQTFDKGYIVAGATSSFGNGATDVYLVKTDSLGYHLWSRTYGGPNIDWGYAVQQTADSGYVIAGFTNSYGNGGYDLYLIRTDSDGDTLWTRTYGGSNWDFGYSMVKTSDGGFILAGGTYSSGSGNEDGYLVKVNSGGDTLWTRTFGGTAEDELRSVWQNADGSYVAAGYTESKGAGGADCYYLKTDLNGDTLWTKTLGGAGEDKLFSMRQTSDGDFIMAGYSNSFGALNYDFYVVKAAAAGDTSWTYRSGGTDNKKAYAITQKSSNGGYFLVGNTSYNGSEIFYFRTHPGPGWMWIWNGTIGDGSSAPENAYSVEETTDGGSIIAGETESRGLGLSDVYLIKTNDTGFTNVYNKVAEAVAGSIPLRIYPNPFADHATMELPAGTFHEMPDLSFSICDIAGRRLGSFPVSSDRIDLPRGELEPGIYFFILESRGNIYSCGKLIVQ